MLSCQIRQKCYRVFSNRWLLASRATVNPPSTAAAVTVGCDYLPCLLIGFSNVAGISTQATSTFYSANNVNHLKNLYNIKGSWCSFQSLADVPAGGVVDIALAQTGEGIAECELLKWFVQEGDQVEEFQPLCEVQSDKATIEITSRYKGKVSQILHDPSDIVKVGETLLKLVVDESSILSSDSLDVLENEKLLDSDSSDSDCEVSSPNNINIGGALSTPAVRNLAKQHGIDINGVKGTGKDGRVLKEDVLRYAAIKDGSLNLKVGEEKQQDLSTGYRFDYLDKTLSLRGFQRAMVKSMNLASKIPHFHFVEEIYCDALVQLKTAFQKENPDPDVKHTFLPILIKSLSMALIKHPMLNSCFNEEMYEVTLKGSHNIGIAMATPYGLVVPNIKNVQSLSILQITKELSRLQNLAVANKLHPDDISAGTITLSNIGAIGGKFGSPLVNVPEVSIIALGRIQKVPHFAADGTVSPVSVMTVNIAADHRILDGATVATFCKEWKMLIEKPELLMLHMR